MIEDEKKEIEDENEGSETLRGEDGIVGLIGL